MATNLISTQTASASASLSFTSIGSYPLYIFKFTGIRIATDAEEFGFQFNVSGASGYNETITSGMWRIYVNTAGSGNMSNEGGLNQEQGTALIKLSENQGNATTEVVSGYLKLYNPSGTVYAKMFEAEAVSETNNLYVMNHYKTGYMNATGAIDDVQFKATSGNLTSGSISMYGID